MTPGEIISRGHDLYVVLAAGGASAAVAPLVLTDRVRVSNAVPVRAGALGDGYVFCATTRLDSGTWSVTGYHLTIRDLEACQQAARRALADKQVAERYAPLCAFEQARPRIPRSGGRRVGARLSV